MVTDIGRIIFVDFLRMTQYPGSPFTGNIIQDLVMVLFIPSIILIVFFWGIAHRVPGVRTHKGLQILLSLALYFFVIFQGFYGLIASSMPLYLLILIIAGVFWFIGGHGEHANAQERKGGYGRPYPGRGYPGSEGQVLSEDIRQLRIERDRQRKRCDKAIGEVENIERRIEREAAASHDTRAWAGRLETAARQRDEVQAKLNALEDRIEELEVGYSVRKAGRRFR